jgi:hypothetical protein
MALSLLTLATAARGADAITPQLSSDDGNVVGQPITLTLTIKSGSVTNITLPKVDGLTLNGSGTNPPDFNFFITPTRAGDFTIPAFDIRTDDGQTIHVNAVKFHVGS